MRHSWLGKTMGQWYMGSKVIWKSLKSLTQISLDNILHLLSPSLRGRTTPDLNYLPEWENSFFIREHYNFLWFSKSPGTGYWLSQSSTIDSWHTNSRQPGAKLPVHFSQTGLFLLLRRRHKEKSLPV